MGNFLAVVKDHELDASTDGLAYFVPPRGISDPLGAALRERGGERATQELKGRKGEPDCAVLKRGYGSKAAYLVVVPAPQYDPVTRAGGDAYALALRACLNAADERGLQSLTFRAWSLSASEMPGRLAALLTYQTLNEWKTANRKRTLKRVVLALHDREGYDIFKRVGSMPLNSSVIALPNITGEDTIWKVERLLF